MESTRAAKLDEVLAVFEAAEPGAPLATSEVADRLSVGRRAAYDRLERLVETGDLQTKKVGARGRVWWRSASAARAGADTDRELALSRLVDNVPGMVYRCRTTEGWPMEFVSDAATALTGYTPAELTDGAVSFGGDVIHPEDRAEVRTAVEAALETDGQFSLEYRIVTAEDETRWVRERGSLVPGSDQHLEGVITDITEEKQAEDALREERDLADNLLETAPAGILVIDEDGAVVRANDRAKRELGFEGGSYEIGEVDVYDDGGEYLPREQRPTVDILATGEAFTDWHCQIDLADGRRRWYAIDGTPLSGDGIGEAILVGRDITPLKAESESLQRQRDELSSELEEIFGRVDDGFYALDEQFRFTYVNERAATLLQREAEALRGESVWEAFPAVADTGAEQLLRTALETQTVQSGELHFEPLETWFDVRVYPSKSGLSVYFRDVTDRKEREQTLTAQRERLAAMDDLNAVVREINEALVAQSTREEIEELVCERLAERDSYSFAWIGEVDTSAQTIRPRTEAGADGYAETIELSTDPDEPTGRGPAGRAVRKREIQVTQDALSDPNFRPWREYATEFGYRSAALLPIEHEETLYGVLGIYAERAGAFTAEEREVVAQLGETIGHAIAAVERKQALMSDEVIELEISVPEGIPGLPSTAVADPMEFHRAIPVGDGDYLVYGETSEDGLGTLERGVEETELSVGVQTLTESDDRVRFELRLADPTLLSAVAVRGGSFEGATLSADGFRLTVHLPPSVDVRGFTEEVETGYETAEVVARRQRSRDDVHDPVLQTLATELTDRQRAALEASYQAGFFEWPREHSGEEIAESLGVSPPTFHQHLRAAEGKLLGALLEE